MRLFLSGIETSGRHGAKPGEKDEPQTFVVDLDVAVDVEGDTLAGTADYRALILTVREVVAGTSFDLLESIAAAVARAVAAHEGVAEVTTIVHKPAAARSNDVQGVAAGFTFRR